jgi:hypothetical protein
MPCRNTCRELSRFPSRQATSPLDAIRGGDHARVQAHAHARLPECPAPALTVHSRGQSSMLGAPCCFVYRITPRLPRKSRLAGGCQEERVLIKMRPRGSLPVDGIAPCPFICLLKPPAARLKPNYQLLIGYFLRWRNTRGPVLSVYFLNASFTDRSSSLALRNQGFQRTNCPDIFRRASTQVSQVKRRQVSHREAPRTIGYRFTAALSRRTGVTHHGTSNSICEFIRNHRRPPSSPSPPGKPLAGGHLVEERARALDSRRC